MKSFLILFAFLISLLNIASADATSNEEEKYARVIKRIYEAIVKDSSAWERMAYMCDTFGPRLTGSENLSKALDWIESEMQKDGLTNVRREPVMAPHWVRGQESCELIEPRRAVINVLGIGGTIATPHEGITAPVMVVESFEELEAKSEEARGKIVLFNPAFKGYGYNVQYRFKGAFEAARYGAVASLIRSISPIGMQKVHTGMMGAYPDTLPKIPHAAISFEDAEMLYRMYKRGQQPVVKLYLEAQTFDDVLTYNLMSEYAGTTNKEEIIALGGHIDSWDVGTGAHDDAGGCIAAWMAVKLLKDLGIRTKRTLRVVMWANEENGARGGKAYSEAHKDEPHHLMLEFDSGVFPPSRLGYTGSDEMFERFQSYEQLFQIIGNIRIQKGGGGVDIKPMMQLGVPGIGLNTNDEGKYFWYHHAPTDTPDKINPNDLNHCIAAIAAAIYLYSELD